MAKTLTKKNIYELPGIWRHIAGWALLISYETAFVYLSEGSYRTSVLKTIPYYALNISFFYCTYYSLNYAFSRKKLQYLTIIILIIAEFAIYLLIKIGFDYVMLPTATFKLLLLGIKRYITLNFTRAVYFWLLGLIYWSITRMARYREAVNIADKQTIILLQEKAGLERDLSDTRFAYYQQQINPHFLFNTLNFIYNSVYKYSAQASNAIVLLSDIMRYSLDDMDIGNKTPLEKEIEQIQNLIEINKLRYNHELCVEFETEGQYEHVKFIPLILLTFAENVFKYGNIKDPNNPARLKLAVVNNGTQLVFETWNKKKTRTLLNDSTGIGLKNTVKRLEYTYPDNFVLDTNDEPGQFYLKLTVNV